jgi:hypothetical protein
MVFTGDNETGPRIERSPIEGFSSGKRVEAALGHVITLTESLHKNPCRSGHGGPPLQERDGNY